MRCCSAFLERRHVSHDASETKQNDPTPQLSPLRRPAGKGNAKSDNIEKGDEGDVRYSPLPATRLIPATPAAVAMPISRLLRAHGILPIRERSLTGSMDVMAARSLVASAFTRQTVNQSARARQKRRGRRLTLSPVAPAPTPEPDDDESAPDPDGFPSCSLDVDIVGRCMASL